MHGHTSYFFNAKKVHNKRKWFSKGGKNFFHLQEANLSFIDENWINVDITAKHKGIVFKPGVYIFFIEDKTMKDVLYVGSTKSLYNRLTSHWGHGFAKRTHSDFTITLKYFITDKFKDMEKKLIRELKPIMNTNENWSYIKFKD